MHIAEWFLSLGDRYGVDPFAFGAIYLGAVPFFMVSIAWIVRNLRRRRPIVLPVLSAGFFFLSAYLYLLVAGRGIPVWVSGVVVMLLGYGVYSTVMRIRRSVKATRGRLVESRTTQQERA